MHPPVKLMRSKDEAEEIRLARINELIDQSEHELEEMMSKRRMFFRHWGDSEMKELGQSRSIK